MPHTTGAGGGMPRRRCYFNKAQAAGHALNGAATAGWGAARRGAGGVHTRNGAQLPGWITGALPGCSGGWRRSCSGRVAIDGGEADGGGVVKDIDRAAWSRVLARGLERDMTRRVRWIIRDAAR